MKPILGTTSVWAACNALGQRAAVILTVFFGLAMARADITGFTDAFATNNWSHTPIGYGSVYFTNSDTELVLAGPTGTPPTPSSFDGIQYNELLGGGLVVGGTVQFHWDYSTSGDEIGNRGGTLSYTPAGNGGIVVSYPMGTGNAPANDNFSQSLEPGSTLAFLLDTETPDGKPLGNLSTLLIISNFRFLEVPEPSSKVILAVAALCFGAAHRQRARIRARGH